MLEILITLVIVAIALLGTAGLQVYAMRVSQGGQFRTQAVFLASDIAERMEANKAAAVAGSYVSSNAAPAVMGTDCLANPCDSANLALYDRSQWEAAINSLLPQPTWQITQTTAGNPSTYSIVISWVDRRTNTTYGTFNAASSVGINAAGTGERFSYTSTRIVSN